ncbi:MULTISPECIES: class I SAM-dependent methyltransferase [unclassified Azospirillum]|uniref:class I SAM-dependent methyltransferase n=1 Tax=unclassified Azospirillum TaxID=2630922 RepID=UPI000B6DB9CF|nr:MULTISPECIES: class I SAM-dependent methyltransferase [unclassified Azospirillum]SNS47159.1 Tetratricopeptide repeat-containing protein [Azospirillum sp. RU38E]SNS66324.1 Tetratricopeptide repeat-containing protein [Azospirillum sp. RU37A]
MTDHPLSREAQAADLLAGGRYRAARRLLLEGQGPQGAGELALLGRALIGLHEHGGARAALEQALALVPDDPAIRFDLARALNGLGLMHLAVPMLEALHAAHPDDAALADALATALRRDARYEDTISFAESLENAGLVTEELLYQRALSAHALGDAAGALAVFDRLLTLRAGHAAGLFASHACLLALQGLPAALARLEQAAACPGANRKYRAFLDAYHSFMGEPVTDGGGNGGNQAILEGALALRPHLAPDCRLFGLSADLLRHGLEQAQVPGLVLEFGVRRGTSLRHIAAAAGQPVHGFDSFEGLPESWGNEPAGTFSTGTDLPAMPGNVTLHPGWFDQTLPGFLADHPGPVRFVNVDCDIYSSSVTVLTALAPRLAPGSVLVFDEFIGNRSWADHEFKAFQEYAAAFGVRFHYIAVSPFTGQVAIRLLSVGN